VTAGAANGAAVAAGPSAICVVGPPRSGTSLTTRILNLAGVYLGPEEDLVPAGRWNPQGFWEHQRIVALNERLLAHLGGSVSDPPKRLPPGWEASESLAAERREARALLREAFGGRPLWGWKDPRASLTLPFWRPLLANVRFVVCLRNPIDVAASAEGIGPAPSARADVFAAWLRYTAAALANTSGCRRIVVSYDDYAERGRDTVARLWRFAGNERAPADGELERLRDAIDHALLRRPTPPPDVLRDADLPAQAGALYLIAELLARIDRAGGDEAGVAARLEAAVDSYTLRQLGDGHGDPDRGVLEPGGPDR
jgi:hypothetical protein